MSVLDGHVERDGQVFVTAAAAPRYLGPDVTPALVRKWQERGLVDGVLWWGRRWYPLAALEVAEAQTFGRTNTRTNGDT